jgi:hypothetical protein
MGVQGHDHGRELFPPRALGSVWELVAPLLESRHDPAAGEEKQRGRTNPTSTAARDGFHRWDSAWLPRRRPDADDGVRRLSSS